jgi:hypothetical protein
MSAPQVPSFASGSSLVPAPPNYEPSNKQRKRDRAALQEALQEARGCLNEEWLDCLTFSWDEAATAPVVEAQDGLVRVIGKFWKVGTDGSDRGVYRQEAGLDGKPNADQLWLWFEPLKERKGWYVSPRVGSIDEPNASVAWAAESVGSLLPPCSATAWHIPYWASKKIHGLVCEPQHTYADKVITQRDENIKMLESQVEQVNGSLQERTAMLDVANGTAEWTSSAKGKDKNKSKGKDKGSGKGKQQGKSGWMNRSIPLMAAILDEDYVMAEFIAKTYIEQFPTTAPLVQRARDLKTYNQIDAPEVVTATE